MDSPRPEAEPFLSLDLEKSDSHYTPSHHNKSAHISRITWRVLTVHTAIALSYTTLITAPAYRWADSEKYSNADRCFTVRSPRPCIGRRSISPQHPHLNNHTAPARPAVTHEVHDLTSSILLLNPFVGASRPELDEAWDSLLRSTSSIPSNHLYIAHQPTPPDSYVRVSTPEYTRLRLNRSTLELADGSGHVLSLGVYHSLHRLKQVHKWIYRGSYPEKLFGAKLEVRRWHIGTFCCT